MDGSPQRGSPRIYLGLPIVWYIHKWSVLVHWKLPPLQLRWWQYGFILGTVVIWCDIYNLQLDCNHANDWFTTNGMKANPNKFQFMILSSSLEPVELVLDAYTCVTSQDCVKIVLSITIDKQHLKSISVYVAQRLARQLNAFARISKYLNQNSRRAIHHSFIANNFSYCPLVCHFCGKSNMAKLEKIQERSHRILCNNYMASYEDLLRNTGSSTLLFNRLKCILLETFNSTQHLNAECLHGICKTHMTSGPQIYRNLNVNQPHMDWDRSRIFELDYGILLWKFSFLCEIDYNGFREFVG